MGLKMRAARKAGIALATLFLATACIRRGAEPDAAERAAIAAEVEAALRDAYDLSKPGVLDRMLALYPRSGRVVSAVSGGVLTSRDSIEGGIRYFWNNVGVNMREPRWEWGRFYIDVLSSASAAVTATYRIPHRNPRNEPHVLGGAMTVVLSKRDGRWVIVQEHLSDLPQGEQPAAHD
jgi:hypothetical protein